jgi:prepilin-type N-terminal cleavage/methylation domain-containing protein
MRGFTLIELLVVVALSTIILGFGIFATMGMYRSQLSRSDRDAIVSELQYARGNALANMYQKAWGVCYDGSNYVVFRDTYVADPATRELAAVGADVTVASVPSTLPCSSGGVIFSQLSGSVAAATTITVTQNAKAATISINNEGGIIW